MKKYLLILCAYSLLTGCASVPVQVPSELATTHGYVYVNLPKGGYGESLMIQPLQENKEGGKKAGKELGLIARKDPEARAFGRWVPAGEYRIAKWHGSKVSGYPNFAVKAGHLTDLGSLIPFNIGGYEIVVLPVRHPDTANDVSLALGEHKPFLVSMEPIEWRPQAPPKPFKLQQQSSGLGLIADLISQYERNVNKPSVNKQLREATSVQDFARLAMAAMPPLTDEPGVDAQSNLYYGADFGQIRVRNRDAEWSAIDTGTLRKVTAVEVHDKSLMAGFDNGMIRGSDNGGKTWKQLASLARDESIVDIDRVSDRWLVTTMKVVPGIGITFNVEKIKVYMAAMHDFSDLSAVKESVLKPPYFVLFPSVRAQAWKNFYYVAVMPDLLRLDVSSGQWKSIAPGAVSGFRISPETETIAAYLAKGMFSTLYVSTDLGASWNEYEAPPYAIQDIYFEGKDKGRAARWRMDAFSGANELLEYNPVKKDWKKTAETPQGCNRVLWDMDNLPKFCITIGGSILRHEKTEWVVEFSAE